MKVSTQYSDKMKSRVSSEDFLLFLYFFNHVCDKQHHLITFSCCMHIFSLAARNLILVLKDHDVRPVLLSGLVTLLRPAGEVQRHQNLEGNWPTALNH